MEQDTQDKLQQLMQMAQLGAQSPVTTNGYGLYPPSPFAGFPTPEDQFAEPESAFPFPIGGWSA